MDKQTEKRYKKLLLEQEKTRQKIDDFVRPLNQKLIELKQEEQELMAQEFLAICEEKHLDLFTAESRLKNDSKGELK